MPVRFELKIKNFFAKMFRLNVSWIKLSKNLFLPPQPNAEK